MPLKLHWTERQDRALRQLRAVGTSWEVIAKACGVSRNAALERAKKLHIRVARPSTVKSSIAAIAPELSDRLSLAPGHAVSWAVLTEGTLLQGERFTSLGALGRTRAKVVGDS